MRGMSAVSLAGERRGSPLLELALARREEKRRRELDWQEYLKRQEMQKSMQMQRQQFQVQLGTLNMLAERIQNTNSPTERQLIIKNNKDFVKQMTRHPQMGQLAKQIVSMSQLNPRKIREQEVRKQLGPRPTPKAFDIEQKNYVGIAKALWSGEDYDAKINKIYGVEHQYPMEIPVGDDRVSIRDTQGNIQVLTIEEREKQLDLTAKKVNMTVGQLRARGGYGFPSVSWSTEKDANGNINHVMTTIEQDLVGNRPLKVKRSVQGRSMAARTGAGARSKAVDKFPQELNTAFNMLATKSVPEDKTDAASMFAKTAQNLMDNSANEEDMENRLTKLVESRYPALSGYLVRAVPNKEEITYEEHGWFSRKYEMADGSFLALIKGRQVPVTTKDNRTIWLIQQGENKYLDNSGYGVMADWSKDRNDPDFLIPVTPDFIMSHTYDEIIGKQTVVPGNIGEGAEHPISKVITDAYKGAGNWNEKRKEAAKRIKNR